MCLCHCSQDILHATDYIHIAGYISHTVLHFHILDYISQISLSTSKAIFQHIVIAGHISHNILHIADTISQSILTPRTDGRSSRADIASSSDSLLDPNFCAHSTLDRVTFGALLFVLHTRFSLLQMATYTDFVWNSHREPFLLYQCNAMHVLPAQILRTKAQWP